MSTLRTLKKLVLGETWTLPIGLAITLAAAAALRSLAPSAWSHLGGLALAAAVLLVLCVAVSRSAGRGRRRAAPGP
jgi:hypothetical protein